MPRLAPPLSATKLKSLKPSDKPYEVSDGARPGLKVEILPSGKKVFRYRYLLNGRREKLTLGEVSLEKARQLVDEAKELIEQGASPAQKKQTDKEASRDDEATVSGFYEHRFLPDHLSKKRTHHNIDLLLRREMLPKLGRLRMDAVTKADVLSVLDNIKSRGHEPTAVLTRAWMSSFFELAKDRGRISENPAAAIKRKRIGAPASRDRVMTFDELGAYVAALRSEAESVSIKHRLALEFILLTATRRGEITAAEWSEVDLQARTWTIPPAKQKASVEHRVYLSNRSADILRQLKEIAGASPWVLPADRILENSICPEILNRARFRLVRDTPALKALPHFTTHDGRRSFSTWAHENLTHPDVVEACLGHSIKGVRGIYARPQFQAARAALMEAWADHLSNAAASRTLANRADEVLEHLADPDHNPI